MKSSEFFDGERIVKPVLDWLQDSKNTEITDRIKDQYSDGMLEGDPSNVMRIFGKDNVGSLSDYYHVWVARGVAYKNGERITTPSFFDAYDITRISDTTDDGLGNPVSTPHSTGSFDIPMTSGSINYLWIAYLLTTDETVFSTHKITRARQFYKRTNGYQILVNTTGANPDPTQYLFLGSVDCTGGAQAVSSAISTTGREIARLKLQRVAIQTPLNPPTDKTTTYSAGNNVYALDDHIKAVGAGTVSASNPHGTTPADIGAISFVDAQAEIEAHQKFYHSSGISGDSTSIVSSLSPQLISVSPGLDYIAIYPLNTGEKLLFNGVDITSTTFPAISNVNFLATDANGTWWVYVDELTKTLMKTQVDLTAMPDVSKFVICSALWTYPGIGGGDLSNLTDLRIFGTVSAHDLQVNAVLTTSIKDENVTAAKIDSSIAGIALAKSGVNPLNVVVDNSTIYVNGSNQIAAVPSATLVPAGAVIGFAGNAAPAGWLLCNGAMVSRTLYANLFAAIGTTWGIGDGFSTFTLPDLRSRSIVGSGQGTGLSNRILGQSLGEETHLLTTSEMPAHAHSITDPGHNHVSAPYTGAVRNTGDGTTTSTDYTVGENDTKTMGAISIAATGITVNSTAVGVAHNNMQPSVVCQMIIKY